MATANPVRAVNDRETRERLSGTAIKSFLKLAAVWGLTTAEQLDLLGASISRGTLTNWVRGDQSLLSADQLMRISYLLGIYEGIQRIWRRAPAIADAWPRQRRYDAPFGGATPVELLQEGGIPAFAAVRAYVDGLTGGPPSRAEYVQPSPAREPRPWPIERPERAA